MAGQTKRRRLVYPLLVLGVVALSAALVTAQDVLRWSHQVAGDSKPIVIDADEIATWTEGSQRIILLRGTGLVENGVLRARMQEGVIWIDQENRRKTGIYKLDLYGEGGTGEVLLEEGLESRSSTKALIALSTRGELKIKAHNGKVVQEPRTNDPLYLRARAERGLPTLAPANPIQRIAAQEEVTTPVPPTDATLPAFPAIPLPTPETNPAAPPAPGPDTLPSRSFQPQGPTPGTLPPAPPNPAPVPGSTPVPAVPPEKPPAPKPAASARQLRIAPRSANPFQTQSFPMPNGEQAIVVTGGVILTIRGLASNLIDIEADRLVFWTRGGEEQSALDSLRSPQGQASDKMMEFYLTGNVEIRNQNGKESRIIRADEVYYDVNHNTAVAMHADLETRQTGQPEPIHVTAEELQQLTPNDFKLIKAEIFSTKLPSDPGLKITFSEATFEESKVPKTTLFGQPFIDRATGQQKIVQQSLFKGTNFFLEIENVPVFYLPYLAGDVNEPLGPLSDLVFNYDQIFGFQAKVSWNMYELLGMDPVPGTRWRLHTDYLSKRGPALGTDFDYFNTDLFGLPAKNTGMVRAYGIQDNGMDNLGGGRGQFVWPFYDDSHPVYRGRFLWRQNTLDLPNGFTVQAQASALSDQNFLEQYYKPEFDTDINQETFLYVKQQEGNAAWTGLTEGRIRNWVTETEWLPRADGWLIGQSFFDLLTYNTHASAGYAQLQPTHITPFPVVPTDVKNETGRYDWFQELSMPFNAGPFKVVPYGVLDLTYYTDDLANQARGRFYGAGGTRASIPFSRLYPEINSDLFNLNGINHKIVWGSNYYIAHSDTPLTLLPQLDRLDDDATDHARRDIFPIQQAINPGHGLFLSTLPQFDIQQYALRRLVDTRTDSLDSIEVLEGDVRQRWQTKRGYPGMEHIIDWMTLDLSTSFFPHSGRDNYGEAFAFSQYDWVWNIGDRTALTSSGWYDPFDQGARAFNVGAYFNRTDRTNFFLGYRQIYPLESQAVTGAVTYVFSPKYALTGSSTYDFGTGQSLSNSISVTRTGTDLAVSVSLTYNAITSNFGFNFEIFPNMVPMNKRSSVLGSLANNLQQPR